MEATLKGIEYCVFLEVPPPLTTVYRDKVLKRIYENHLKQFHSIDGDEKIDFQELFQRICFGWAVDRTTYIQNFSLWAVLSERVQSTGRPIPAAKALVPAAVSAWNLLKGGVDVYSRVLKNAKPEHPRLKIHGSILLRFFLTFIMNAHLVTRAFEVIKEVPSENSFREYFKTYDQFKPRLNSKRSFKEYLLVAYRNLDKISPIVSPLQQSDEDQTDCISLIPINVAGKRRRKRDHFNRGGFAKVRLRKGHKLTVTEERAIRRIVCCVECLKKYPSGDSDSVDIPKHFRQGYGKRYSCNSCAVGIARETSGMRVDSRHIDSVIPLCSLARFPNDRRTCFEIHHSPSPYPKLYCKGVDEQPVSARRQTKRVRRVRKSKT